MSDDRTAIMSLAAQWVPALQSGGAAGSKHFYTDDVVVAGGEASLVHVGRGQLEKILEQLLTDMYPDDCSIDVESIELAGDWAELRARFKAEWKPKRAGLEPESESSNYIWLLKRQGDGSWRIARFLFYPNV